MLWSLLTLSLMINDYEAWFPVRGRILSSVWNLVVPISTISVSMISLVPWQQSPDWLLPTGYFPMTPQVLSRNVPIFRMQTWPHIYVLSGTKSVHLLGQESKVLSHTVILEVLVSWKTYCSSQRFRLIAQKSQSQGRPFDIEHPISMVPKKVVSPATRKPEFLAGCVS